MRIASRCLARQRDYLSKFSRLSHPHTYSQFGLSRQHPVLHKICYSGIQDGIRPVSNVSQRYTRKRDADKKFTIPADKKTTSDRGRSIQPAELVAKLDKYLPPNIDGVFSRSSTTGSGSVTPELTLRVVDTIYSRARNQLGFELFEWMIENGYEKAAVWIIGEVLRKIPAMTNKTFQRPPSNISWPSLSCLSGAGQSPITLTTVNDYNFEAVGLDPQPSGAGRPAHLLLNAIWTTLGRLVVKAADLDILDSGRVISARYMSAVFLTLGHMHSLGFMPDNIYAYNPSVSSTFVQRPPILHLISSRILASISDATWRDNLSDAIAQATARGISLEKLTEAVAGSRFNVRVRDMGPEVWLELILWCCVETDQRSAAVSIVKALQECHDNPWFAVRWNPSLSSHSFGHGATIDWNKVKLRTGGTVGSIEGYSLDKPFIDVPPRTISVEVVLAIVELCINTCSSGIAHGSNARTIDTVQADVSDVVAFLEPHDLPLEYLDYLGNRVMFAADFESVKSPASLQKWASLLQDMQRLETTKKKEVSVPDLSLKSVLSHSQFLSSVQQQALDRLIQSGDVHNSLQLFNDIQETIDRNKFNSIAEFLQTQQAPDKSFFSPRPFPDRLEYVDSYGQLPYHRLASFLNLLSDNNMIGMGQWLLYADEVDGAVIPPSAYRLSSMTGALLKFAAVTQDAQLRSSILNAGSSTKRLPTVRFLRQLVNTSASVQDFRAVYEFLRLLRPSEGGGAGIENIVYLAATLLRLECDLIGKPERKAYNVQMTTNILEEILRGDWNTVHGTFPTLTRKSFLQDVGRLLKIFAHTESHALESLAQSHIARFPPSNEDSLPARYFNTLLTALVDAYGSSVGKRMWILFCGDIDVSQLDDTLEPDSISSKDQADWLDAPAEASGTESESTSGNPPTHLGSPSNFEVTPGTSRHSQSAEPYTGAEVNFEDPFFPKSQQVDELDHLLQPMKITRPNMQTVRIIVGAAIQEQKQLRQAGLLSPKQDNILAWAYWMFKSITASDEKLIEQEIQQPIRNLSNEIKQHLEHITDKTTNPSQPLLNSAEKSSSLWAGAQRSKAKHGDKYPPIKRVQLELDK